MLTTLAVAAFAGGLGATLVLTPFFRFLAQRRDLLDRPGEGHKRHSREVPLLGGFAMFSAWTLGIASGIAAALTGRIPGVSGDFGADIVRGVCNAAPALGAIFAGALAALVLGFYDDCRPMSAQWKFLGQFFIALLAVGPGEVRFNCFIGSDLIVGAISVFWVMLMMNSINFFDNMDGLAAGTLAISFALFSAVALLGGQIFISVLSALSCGVVCGFWYYNAAPATIFMGDSGSHFLGYLVAVIAAKTTFFYSGVSLSRLPQLMPLFILALPLFDTAMVVAIRTWNRRPFWIGDLNHISHRFVRMGLSRKQAVALVHLLALAIGIGILPVYWGKVATAVILTLQSVLMIGIITFLQLTLAGKEDPRR
ncbi:MAG: undecaprenyl/decaprenyl-phosphate alpha-N-acetylglucosaminyl 1-phosphate transferase [Victivallaceae bacterium]|nr:undecaprenyl/decaprenyl-phosphate alpha-N-acetylglucosaminyl 1-phosphate transferase [Victivallaceae bacterium]